MNFEKPYQLNFGNLKKLTVKFEIHSFLVISAKKLSSGDTNVCMLDLE